MNADDVRAARSLLFVPGNRPERFDKAVAAQPDVVILDIEDAVAGTDKDAARAHVGQWLSAGHSAMVRINAADTPWHEQDLALVAAHRPAVMLAKAERVEQITPITELAPGAAVVPLIETAAGVAAATELCAVPGVARVAFGSIDLANELGVDPEDREALLLHRSTLVLASVLAGVAPPIDGVTTVFTETGPVTDDFTYAGRLGMSAKLCIHPAQVAAVHAAAAPSEADIAWATKVVAAAETADGSAAAVDGRMIDLPVVDRARRILAVAQRV
ncbi:CoA ester lyase [Mycolicibacterium sp.]|uniref:HpcH/HpaI aldolase/citrate lyase family protein n=1 Tax=Mycolicibacterium sp. TaxID=2320850 RepID=UPI00355E5B8B